MPFIFLKSFQIFWLGSVTARSRWPSPRRWIRFSYSFHCIVIHHQLKVKHRIIFISTRVTIVVPPYFTRSESRTFRGQPGSPLDLLSKYPYIRIRLSMFHMFARHVRHDWRSCIHYQIFNRVLENTRSPAIVVWPLWRDGVKLCKLNWKSHCWLKTRSCLRRKTRDRVRRWGSVITDTLLWTPSLWRVRPDRPAVGDLLYRII